MDASTPTRPPSLPDLRVVPVAYGIDAARALHRCVADAKADDPLAPVTVVVASNYVGVATRRRLAAGELGPVCAAGVGIAGVTFVTPYRLAELLGAPVLAATGRRPVSTPVVAAGLRRVLADAPGIFADVASHAATEEALVGAYRELSAVGAAGRAAVAASGRRAADVVRICTEARDRLCADWYDEADLVDAACGALPGAAVTAELGTVVVYLPQDTNKPMRDLLAAVARNRPVAVVAGRTGVDRADAAVREVLVAVGGAEAAATFDAYDPPPGPVGGAALEVVTTSDADDEVRTVVRRVVDAARDGVPLERIAVLYGTPQPYARLLHEHLAAAGIAFCGAAVRPVSERLAGRVLLDLLALAEGGFRRRDVMALLAGAPLRDSSGAYIPSTQWRRISREAGVVGGDHWDVRLAHLADTSSAEADAEDASDEPNPARSARLHRDADAASRLRGFVLDLAARLAPEAMGDTWAARAAAAGRLLTDLLGDATVRHGWPEAERHGAERVEAALARLAGLDGVEQAVSAEVFHRALRLELDDDLGRVGRLGEGVFIGPVGAGIALDLDRVCVVGLAEGILPRRAAEDALLSDAERRAAGGELALRGERAEVEHRQLIAAMASARRSCLVSFPRGDLRASSERMPSRWLLDVVEEHHGERVWSEGLTGMGVSWLHTSPSFASGVTSVAFPATEQEYRIRALDVGASATGDPVIAAAAEMLHSRAGSAFTRFDGNLSGCDTTATTRKPVSASVLQDYVKCPHAFLLGHVLRAAPLEEPDEQLDMTALDYGNLVHAVLEAFVVEALADGGVPAPQQCWSDRRRERLHEIADECMDGYEARGLAGRPLFAAETRRRLHADLDGFLADDAATRAELGTRPVAAELAFGLDGRPPLTLKLADGRVLTFRGRADRVDEDRDGRLFVYDYKTGKPRKEHRDLTESAPDAGGTLLQLPLYGVAVRDGLGRPTAPVQAQYWFVTGRGGFKRHGYEVTDAVLERFEHVLGAIALEMDTGVFPARPHDKGYSGFTTCPWCDPDGLGTNDTNLAWARKRGSAALAGLIALVEEEAGNG